MALYMAFYSGAHGGIGTTDIVDMTPLTLWHVGHDRGVGVVYIT